MNSTARKDIYQEVTDRIISAMEAGTEKWQMPWAARLTMPRNALTGAAYRGINILALWIAGDGFASSYWATYKQWEQLGAQVKKGSKASKIIICKPIEKTTTTETGEDLVEERLLVTSAAVFNADQVEGWEAPQQEHKPLLVSSIAAAEDFVASTGAVIRHGGAMACYSPSADVIKMPTKEDFHDTAASTATENYYSTLLHELTHWTGAEHRLNRTKGKTFGSPEYAFEELVAELGAAFLCAELGITPSPREDHASYLQSWLSVLKDDKKAIFRAARLAQQACEYLASLQAAEAA